MTFHGEAMKVTAFSASWTIVQSKHKELFTIANQLYSNILVCPCVNNQFLRFSPSETIFQKKIPYFQWMKKTVFIMIRLKKKNVKKPSTICIHCLHHCLSSKKMKYRNCNTAYHTFFWPRFPSQSRSYKWLWPGDTSF